jgi:hypothetical protein
MARTQQIAAAVQALNEFTAALIGAAAEIAPVGGGLFSPNDPAPGTLQASATFEPAQATAESIESSCGFNTVYAARQHEELDWNHESPGQAKYLENTMRERTPKLAPHVAAKMKGALG